MAIWPYFELLKFAKSICMDKCKYHTSLSTKFIKFYHNLPVKMEDLVPQFIKKIKILSGDFGVTFTFETLQKVVLL